MGRHGENIHQRKDGRWEGRCSARAGGIRKNYSVYGRSYSEAKEKLAEKKRELCSLGEGAAAPDGKACTLRLSEAAEAWLGCMERRRKPSTCAKYRYICSHYLIGRLGDVLLAELGQKGLEEKLAEGLSGSTARGACSALNRILAYAHENLSAEERKIPVPECPKAARKEKAFQAEEQEKLSACLLEGASGDAGKMGALLALSTGLRLGEVCALKWEDIDMERKVLHVRRTAQRIKDHESGKTVLVEGAPKTASSVRDVPIPEHLAEALAGFPREGAYLLCAGKPMEPRTLQYRFSRIQEEAGVEYKNFHALRHTFATACIRGGADIKCVSELLGHSSAAVTMNCYVHPSEEQKRECVNAAAGIYGQADGR